MEMTLLGLCGHIYAFIGSMWQSKEFMDIATIIGTRFYGLHKTYKLIINGHWPYTIIIDVQSMDFLLL
jgi:hypothetical protein